MFSTPNFRNSDTCKNNFPYEMVKIKLSGLKKGNVFFFQIMIYYIYQIKFIIYQIMIYYISGIVLSPRIIKHWT